MRKYRLTLAFAIAAIVFTIIADITVNRVLIAVLFLVLLTFVAIGDTTIQRLRRNTQDLVETQRTNPKLTE